MRICSKCGTVSDGVKVTPGSFLIEIVLWFCFFVPGLIYSIWRRTSKRMTCPKCRSAELLPLDTPGGQELFHEFGEPKPLESRPTESRSSEITPF